MDLFARIALFLLFLGIGLHRFSIVSALGPITHMCDFETDDCGYINDDTDNYNWNRRRLVTGGLLSGPIGDHTTGLGSFMYADARDGKSGSIARVMTPMLEGSNSVPSSLLTFWFSMWSLNPLEMGTLNVYVRFQGVINPIPVWSTSGVQNAITEWVEAKVLLTSNQEFQVVFESVRGRGSRSDIAIDDIQVINSAIPRQCDFEDSSYGPMCTWYQELIEDDFDWTWHSGETPTLETGPLIDHTYENETGHYFYIEATRDSRETTAQLKTYPMYKDGGVCTISFWLHAYGSDLGLPLSPPLLAVIVNEDRTPITESRTSDPAWRRVSLNLPSITGSYQIIIEGRRSGNSGDIAIDDVLLGNNCVDVDKCASNPCWNGGSCTQTASQFICECVPGYTGLHCQFDIDECFSSPCQEPRVCVDRVDRYECVCEEGYTGENCEEETWEPEPTEAIPFNAYRTPVIIGASCMAGGVVIVTILIAFLCTRSSGKDTSSIGSGSIQNPPTAKELAMKNMAAENASYVEGGDEESPGTSSASSAKDD